MIRASVFYTNRPGAKFDHVYYSKEHANLVSKRLQPLGLARFEIEKGLSGATPDAPPLYVASGHLVFNSIEDFQKAFAAHGEEPMADVPNFTDIEPQIQISEVVA